MPAALGTLQRSGGVGPEVDPFVSPEPLWPAQWAPQAWVIRNNATHESSLFVPADIGFRGHVVTEEVAIAGSSYATDRLHAFRALWLFLFAVTMAVSLNWMYLECLSNARTRKAKAKQKQVPTELMS